MSEIETLPARDGTPLLTRPWDPPGNRDAWATVLPDVRHEPHNDPDGPAIVDAVVAWLRGQLAGPDRLD